MAGLQRGIVKQVTSGDTVIVRGKPVNGPPPERTICLSNVVAPRLARRANPNVVGSVDTKDEPYAWEAREFLRTKLIGKEINFTVEYKSPGNGREYGCIFLKDENITESIVAAGLVELRRSGMKTAEESQAKLIQLEDGAKAAKKGKWAENGQEHVRDISWNVENPKNFVDSFNYQPVDAIIEYVRDGCTVRAFLLPKFHHVTIMLSGIKCPMISMEGTKDEFAEEAKFFTESRLLQREVKVILESISNKNLIGTILHPAGNIAEFLLKEGLARCVDWSIGVVTNGAEKLRAAEKGAKAKKLRIWKDYSVDDSLTGKQKEAYSAKVMEVINGDAMNVKMADGTVKKIFLASIRPPRPPPENPDEPKKEPKGRYRPLYDVPYLYEAREFLRKKLIGKKVTVKTEYLQKATEQYGEKVGCTVTIAGIDVGEALVSKGLATVIRYRQDDDQRSSRYDQLLAAEARASKKSMGVFSKKDTPLHRVADVSGDVNKARQFLPFLQRAGRSEGIVEFVAGGSRMRIFIPKETCLITFLLSGIECPRGSRPGPKGTMLPSEKFGDEASVFSKEMCLQREVEVEVEALDKGGNFIGWMTVEGKNLSLALVEEGLSKVHFTAERSNYYPQLQSAEELAKKAKKNIWSSYEEPKEETKEVDSKERKEEFKKAFVTEVTGEGSFFLQYVDQGPQLESLMESLRKEFSTNPPKQDYTPKKGEMVASKFEDDDQWYRAKVTSVNGSAVEVFYLDYGNSEKTKTTKLTQLPATYQSYPAFAHETHFACVKVPEEEDDKNDYVMALSTTINNTECLVNVEYKEGAHSYVTLKMADDKSDPVKELLENGYLLVERRRERRLAKLVESYSEAEGLARKNRMNLWRYGDLREDDAREFGYQK